MTDTIVDIRDLSKKYGTFTALHGASLQVRRGEIFALLGPNGAGKTTLIGIVTGLVKRSGGTALVDGLDVTEDYRQTRRLVGLVPQEINVDVFFTVEEQLRYQAGYFGVKLSDAELDELLGHLGLLDKKKASTRALSGGMKRRLLIAKALVHSPKVLFLDEPSAGVDVELRRDLWRYVRLLRDRGTTIVLTTHYIEEAEELADRVGIIDKGQVLLVEEKTSLIKRLGTRVLSVRLSEPLAALPPLLVEQGATLAADGLSLSLSGRPEQPFGEKLMALVEAGARLEDVDVRPPRLEEVFMKLIGETEVGA